MKKTSQVKVEVESLHSREENGHHHITAKKDTRRSRGCLTWLVGAVVAVACVLALALGLGLGLKHHHTAATIGSSSSAYSGDASENTTIPSWRRDPAEYMLDMNQWDINAPPTTRVYNLTISEIVGAPDGVVRQMTVINGKFPGPMIRANRGDRLIVNVVNQATNATALHWHGMYQNGTNWMDGTTGITQCPIQPGKSFTYNFTIENQFGTYWYHSHYGTQSTDGVVGPLIIHAPEEASTRKSYDYDQAVLVTDWYHDNSFSLLPGYLASGSENTEPVPDNGLIQGTGYFDCSTYGSHSSYICNQSESARAVVDVASGKRYRLRLINTSTFANMQFSVDNHTLSVIEADGTLLVPAAVHRLELAVAQRYSVILTANQKAEQYWIRAEINTFCMASSTILNSDVRGVLSYSSSALDPIDKYSADWADALDTQCKDLNPKDLVPAAAMSAPDPDVHYIVDVSFEIKAQALDRAYINDTTWKSLPQNPTLNTAVKALSSNAGNQAFTTAGLLSQAYDPSQFVINIDPNHQVVDLLVNNLDEGAHPFHLHGHTFWIMAQNNTGYFDWSTYSSVGKHNPNPMRRDTLTIEGYGWALIRFVADNPGLWAFHCHISWHMEAGLMMQFQERTDIMSKWELPSDVLGLCQS